MFEKRSFENKVAYKRQRNFYVNLSRRKKRKYFENLDFDLFSDDKMFWNSQESNNITQTKRRKVITITMKNVQIRSIQS